MWAGILYDIPLTIRALTNDTIHWKDYQLKTNFYPDKDISFQISGNPGWKMLTKYIFLCMFSMSSSFR